MLFRPSGQVAEEKQEHKENDRNTKQPRVLWTLFRNKSEEKENVTIKTTCASHQTETPCPEDASGLHSWLQAPSPKIPHACMRNTCYRRLVPSPWLPSPTRLPSCCTVLCFERKPTQSAHTCDTARGARRPVCPMSHRGTSQLGGTQPLKA